MLKLIDNVLSTALMAVCVGAALVACGVMAVCCEPKG